MDDVRWKIQKHRGEYVLSLHAGHATIWSRELVGVRSDQRLQEARSTRRNFGEANIEDYSDE